MLPFEVPPTASDSHAGVPQTVAFGLHNPRAPGLTIDTGAASQSYHARPMSPHLRAPPPSAQRASFRPTGFRVRTASWISASGNRNGEGDFHGDQTAYGTFAHTHGISSDEEADLESPIRHPNPAESPSSVADLVVRSAQQRHARAWRKRAANGQRIDRHGRPIGKPPRNLSVMIRALICAFEGAAFVAVLTTYLAVVVQSRPAPPTAVNAIFIFFIVTFGILFLHAVLSMALSAHGRRKQSTSDNSSESRARARVRARRHGGILLYLSASSHESTSTLDSPDRGRGRLAISRPVNPRRVVNGRVQTIRRHGLRQGANGDPNRLPDDDSVYSPITPVRVHVVDDDLAPADKPISPLHDDAPAQVPQRPARRSALQPRSRSSTVTSHHRQSHEPVELPVAPPPAYGLWRCSVRADPDLLHWVRVDGPGSPTSPASAPAQTTSFPNLDVLARHYSYAGGESLARPPSYTFVSLSSPAEPIPPPITEPMPDLRNVAPAAVPAPDMHQRTASPFDHTHGGVRLPNNSSEAALHGNGLRRVPAASDLGVSIGANDNFVLAESPTHRLHSRNGDVQDVTRAMLRQSMHA